MTRYLVIFVVTFAVGAVIAVILRTGGHHPYGEPPRPPPMAGMDPHGEHRPPPPEAGMPPPSHEQSHDHGAPPPPPPMDAHHDHGAPPAPAAPGGAVNTICPGCGGPVDPKIPMADYQGKKVGFNCKMCPPKFAAEPQKYGEAALKNKAAE